MLDSAKLAFVGTALLVFVAATFAWKETAPATEAALSLNSPEQCLQGSFGTAAAIPSGRFRMGSEQHYPEEGPVTEVDVEGFSIDRHEVTNAQFAAFVDATGYVTAAERAKELGFPSNGSAVFANGSWQFREGASWRHPNGPESNIEGREHYPVVQVALQDAKAYSEWAGRRLPTESEWEYASRGGLDGKEYAWGDERRPEGRFMANNWDGSFPSNDTGADGHRGIAPVGCYPANGFGLVDMIGNVWEWTDDSYHPRHDSLKPKDAGAIGTDPRQPGVPVGTIKGGSYLCSPDYCMRYRPAARHPQDVFMGTNHIGFRTVS